MSEQENKALLSTTLTPLEKAEQALKDARTAWLKVKDNSEDENYKALKQSEYELFREIYSSLAAAVEKTRAGISRGPAGGADVPTEYSTFWQSLLDNIKGRTPDSLIPLLETPNSVVRMGTTYPKSGSSLLIVRDCYITMYKHLTTVKTLIVQGTPGVGKTSFSVYFVIRKIAEAIASNCVASFEFMIAGESGKFILNSDGSGGTVPANAIRYFCADAITPSTLDFHKYQNVLAVSSPQVANLKGFRKLIENFGPSHKFETLYMPRWTVPELALLCAPNCNMKLLQLVVDVFGGIARAVPLAYSASISSSPDSDTEAKDLQNLPYSPFSNMLAAFELVSREFKKDASPVEKENARRLVDYVCRIHAQNHLQNALDEARRQENALNTITEASEFISSTIFHWVPTEDLKYKYTRYASPFFELLVALEVESMTVGQIAVRNLYPSVQGYLFESLGHLHMLKSKGPVHAAFLPVPREVERRNTTLDFSGRNLRVFRDIESIGQLSAQDYGMPSIDTFAVVGFVLQPDIIGNFTLNKEHGITSDYSRDFLARVCKQMHVYTKEKCLDKIKFVWILPITSEGSFGEQVGFVVDRTKLTQLAVCLHQVGPMIFKYKKLTLPSSLDSTSTTTAAAPDNYPSTPSTWTSRSSSTSTSSSTSANKRTASQVGTANEGKSTTKATAAETLVKKQRGLLTNTKALKKTAAKKDVSDDVFPSSLTYGDREEGEVDEEAEEEEEEERVPVSGVAAADRHGDAKQGSRGGDRAKHGGGGDRGGRGRGRGRGGGWRG